MMLHSSTKVIPSSLLSFLILRVLTSEQRTGLLHSQTPLSHMLIKGHTALPLWFPYSRLSRRRYPKAAASCTPVLLFASKAAALKHSYQSAIDTIPMKLKTLTCLSSIRCLPKLSLLLLLVYKNDRRE